MADGIENADAWRKALRFAALPGAVSVTFSRSVPEPGSIRHELSSYRSDGSVIGDDRSYDLLKPAFGPLERLGEGIHADAFSITYDMRAGMLTLD